MTKSDPHAVMLNNLCRLAAQAEEADAANDGTLADGLWRAVQSHAKQLAPFDPDVAIPAIERVMNRFSDLAADTKDQRLANAYYRLAQSAAQDLAPLRLTKVRVETEDDGDAESPERTAFRRSLIGKSVAELQEMFEKCVDAHHGGRQNRLRDEAQNRERMDRGTIQQVMRVYLSMQSGLNFDDSMRKEGL